MSGAGWPRCTRPSDRRWPPRPDRGGFPWWRPGIASPHWGPWPGCSAPASDPRIVWLDAHGDVQTPETSASGYLGGMALRLLTDYRPELIATRLGLRPVPEERIVLAGSRDLDPPEVEYLASSRIRQCEVAGLGAAPLPDGPLYVHLDMDVISPDEAPGLRSPHRAARSPSRSPRSCGCCWTPAGSSPWASPAPGTPAPPRPPPSAPCWRPPWPAWPSRRLRSVSGRRPAAGVLG